jgi:hypothetical protein
MINIGSMDWPIGDAAGVVALIASAVSIAETYRTRAAVRARSDARFMTVMETTNSNAERCKSLEREVSDYKLAVAQRYASLEALEKIENRLFSAIDGVTVAIRDLGARLDRAFESRKDM